MLTGCAIFILDKAFLLLRVTDGRYSLQAENQLDDLGNMIVLVLRVAYDKEFDFQLMKQGLPGIQEVR